MIIASAIRFGGDVFIGKRHGDAMCQALGFYGVGSYGALRELIGRDCEDGFVTSKLRFLDRKAAYNYAKKNGQFQREKIYFDCHPSETEYHGYNGDELFSEDLW